MRVLITGMCGFIGHHVADHLLTHTDWDLVGLDRIDATSTLHRLRFVRDWEHKAKRVKFVWHDLRAPINSMVDRQLGHVNAVLHLAASTHVDRSIAEPVGFVLDNVVGTTHLLEWWRDRQTGSGDRVMLHNDPMELFVNFSTDEVFGPAPDTVAYGEWSRYNAGNPYSGSKAGAEQMGAAYSNTYKFRVTSTFTMNVFGERQHPEKFIPGTIAKVLCGDKVLIHGNADRTKSGSRFYLHAQNVGHALQWLVERREMSLLYNRWNLVGEREVSNLEMAEMIAKMLQKPLVYEIVDFHSSRPGHDLRYALDGSSLREAGFTYPMSFEQSLERTVKWFVDNPEWLEL